VNFEKPDFKYQYRSFIPTGKCPSGDPVLLQKIGMQIKTEPGKALGVGERGALKDSVTSVRSKCDSSCVWRMLWTPGGLLEEGTSPLSLEG
jgi:hypothetical protein